MTDRLPPLRLQPNAERRLRIGHAWIFSNEVDIAATPLKAFKPGDLVTVIDARGKPVGTAYVNPGTLIAGRLLNGRPDSTIDADWFVRRLRAALALRERLYPTPHYRLVHGESDALPGLVVDRYGDVLVVQLTTAGMDRRKDLVVEALNTVLAPKGILFRNDGGARALEGLPEVVDAVGDVPDQAALDESGVRFEAPLRDGQKTGWFFDQRDNRDRLVRYAKGARVLDVFSYAGAWAIRALAAGAASATCVDRSEGALASANANAALNGFTLETIRGEAMDVLKDLRAAARTFDVVVVDPPALVKRKKDFDAGFEHYAALNRAALQLVAADGILVSCSCSFHLAEEDLQRAILRESRQQKRRLQILEQGGQGPDHPVHPAIPETRYLKSFFCRVAA